MNPPVEPSTHRLFAAIVLMGSGLTLGCGGISEHEHANEPASGGNGGLGGSTSTGGGSVIATGGAWPLPDNTIMPGVAGAPPAPVTPGPFACPPQQWSCSNPFCSPIEFGWALPDDCPCDPARPTQASDCAAGQVFLCRNGTSTADGRPLTAYVAFECSCVDKSPTFCNNECDLAYGVPDAVCDVSKDGARAVCGCAVIFLK